MHTLLWLALAAPASASGDGLLLDTLATWADKAVTELSVEGSPPQRAVLACTEFDQYNARAVFGALESETSHRKRPTRVEVVVGDDALNSVRFKDPSQFRAPTWLVATANLPVEDVPLALERDLWLTTDHAYKAASMRWRVKRAALAGLGGEPPPPEWSDAPSVVAVEPGPPGDLDDELLRQVVTETSARLRGIQGLTYGAAEVTAIRGNYHLASSEGTRLVQPDQYTVVYAWATARRADGVEVDDHLQWVVEQPADLPPVEQMAAVVEAMGRRVAARLEAPVVDYYEGPVVFEGAAAGDLLWLLIAPEVQGTPPAPRAGRTWQELTRDAPRLGRRLLPSGWSVESRPAHRGPGVVGARAYDREGVRTKAVDLVVDGYVRDLAMTRIPRHDLTRSNGHARGSVQGAWEARLSVWTVSPDRLLKPRAFDKASDRSRTAANLDRILVVRQLQRGREGRVPRPADAVWRLPDGTEEPVVDLEFQNVDRRTLRDVVAAAGLQAHTYLAAWEPGSKASRTAGLPSTVLGPSRLLILDMEVVFPGPDERPYLLAPPGLPPG